MSKGIGFVCAHCEHYWWGVERGSTGCRLASAADDCAGPLAGEAFPHYRGPLGGKLAHYCFVCGHKPTAYAEAKGDFVGVCEDHVGMFDDYSRPNEAPAFVTRSSLPIVQG
jgi:hypothetical protein